MKVELTVHASKLANVAGMLPLDLLRVVSIFAVSTHSLLLPSSPMSGFGKGCSDPYAVVTQLSTSSNQKPHVIGKTEVIKNTLSPNWVTSFVLDYELGTPMKVAVQIFDEIRKGDNKAMGSATFDIGEVLGARGGTKAKKLKKCGT